VGHSSVTIAFRMLLAATLGVVGLSIASAQQGGGPQQGQQGQQNWHGGQHGSVYQRKAFDGKNRFKHGNSDFRKDRRFFQQQFPNVQSSWFTRPYPYHLDFYKMKYGGSYAPYFGNLYGPPQVVTAPPYYGPYYGDWGMGTSGYANGSMPDGFNGMNGAGGMPVQSNGFPPGTIIEGPVENGTPNGQPVTQPSGESLPMPAE
jgi:hypothetical protein